MQPLWLNGIAHSVPSGLVLARRVRFPAYDFFKYTWLPGAYLYAALKKIAPSNVTSKVRIQSNLITIIV